VKVVDRSAIETRLSLSAERQGIAAWDLWPIRSASLADNRTPLRSQSDQRLSNGSSQRPALSSTSRPSTFNRATDSLRATSQFPWKPN